MFNPSIRNLFVGIKKTNKFNKYSSIFLILFQYFSLICGGQFFIIITGFLFLSTMLVLILAEDDDIINNFWIFFVLGPGMVAFLIVIIIELINVFNHKRKNKIT